MNRLTSFLIVCAVLLVAILSFIQWRMHPGYTDLMGRTGPEAEKAVAPSK